jgi:hypothetical protein
VHRREPATVGLASAAVRALFVGGMAYVAATLAWYATALILVNAVARQRFGSSLDRLASRRRWRRAVTSSSRRASPAPRGLGASQSRG